MVIVEQFFIDVGITEIFVHRTLVEIKRRPLVLFHLIARLTQELIQAFDNFAIFSSSRYLFIIVVMI